MTGAVNMAPASALTLYELAEERLALDALLSMDEGEVTEAAESLATELAGKLALKADSFGGYVREMEATAAAIREEETRLAARRKALECRVEWLKRTALFALQAMQRPRVEGTLFTLAVQNNPPSVQVECLPGALPLAFVNVIPESYTANKQAIAKALKAGDTVPGCSLAVTQSLRIK